MEMLGNPGNVSEQLIPSQIKYMGGIIKNENMHKFRRMVFRITRGKTFVHSFSLNLSAGDKLLDDSYDQGKNCFVLAFQGGTVMDEMIRRSCIAYAETKDCEVINLQSLSADIKNNE